MAIARNKQYGTPHLRNVNRRLITSKRRFLDGTLRALFAPGQNKDVIDDYTNPTDWPNGVALYAPQVVWLTAILMDFDSEHFHFQQNWYTSPIVQVNNLGHYLVGPDPGSPIDAIDSTYGIFADGFEETILNNHWFQFHGVIASPPGLPDVIGYRLDFLGADSFSYTHQSTLSAELFSESNPDNPNYTIKRRFDTTFQEVQSALSELRPNRTWGTPITWFDDYQFDNNFYTATVINFLNQFDFGTNFLHIHLGPTFQTLGWPTGSLVNPLSRHITTDPVYTNRKGIYPGSYPAFYKYKTICYPIFTDWPTIAHMATFEAPEIPSDDADHDVQVLITEEALEGVMSLGNGVIDNYNLNLPIRDTIGGTDLQAVADDLSAYGFEYRNINAVDFTTDDIIEIIADHFQFDPDTGEDL